MSITHDKNQNPLLNLLNNWKSARLTPVILSLTDDLCNSLINFWFDEILLLIATPEDLFIKEFTNC